MPSEEADSSLISLTNQWVIRFKDLLSIPKLSDEPFAVKPATKVKSNKYGDVYPMTSHPRGFCIIIDNQLFAGNTLPFRTGSRNDAYRLADVFSQLLFDVKLYTNKTSVEMKTLLQDVIAKNNELVSHDALAIIILSHGVKDEIYGTDGLTVSVDTIIGYFNNKNCPLLINKPKMFFLSACRGSQIDSGIKKSLNSSPRPMGSLGAAASVMPTWSDIFVYYSTIEGYASLRNVSTGSWFGYELANCLAEFAHREHLHDLVTIKVAERLHERISEMNGSTIKQAIETQTKGFVKKLYFNPGFCAIEKK
ncbi:unnamed protein product [Medioppia subpectinata]|uniref:Caspase-3 n=1 Tax=Medioppia subpectinata TaxID=1979941 RepID=A0A7R9PY41_9ACAR|nr:unnamed protein product [Medioppia subpectinata]CAG2105677.1 unnamed protein product [Medioppia subpectinata]